MRDAVATPLVDLLLNACDACGNGGHVRLRVTCDNLTLVGAFPRGTEACIEIPLPDEEVRR